MANEEIDTIGKKFEAVKGSGNTKHYEESKEKWVSLEHRLGKTTRSVVNILYYFFNMLYWVFCKHNSFIISNTFYFSRSSTSSMRIFLTKSGTWLTRTIAPSYRFSASAIIGIWRKLMWFVGSSRIRSPGF